MDDPRMRALLAAVAVLAALRLLVVPWVHAQSEAHERLQVLTRRLDRSQGVVEARTSVAQADATLKKEIGELLARFPAAPDTQAFKLEAQRQLERLARDAGLAIKVVGWVSEGEIPKSGLAYARVRFGVVGALRDAARLHAEIEAQLPNVAIREWQGNVTRADRTDIEAEADVVIVADLYFAAPPV